LGIKKVEVSVFDELGGGYCHRGGEHPVSFILKAGMLGQPDFCFTAFDRMRLAEKSQ